MSANTDLFLRGAQMIAGLDEASFEFLAEDVHFEPLRAATEGSFRGHDGIRRFFADTRESFDRFEIELDDVRDLPGGRVIGFGTIHVRGRASGIETDIPTAIIATFHDGRLTHFKDFGERSAALAAAGVE